MENHSEVKVSCMFNIKLILNFVQDWARKANNTNTHKYDKLDVLGLAQWVTSSNEFPFIRILKKYKF